MPETRTAAAPTESMRPQPFRIKRVTRELPDTFTMALVPPDERDPCRFAPGQFNMLYVFGVGEVPISLSGDPAQTETFIHTTRAVGAVTRAMQRLKVGATVGLRGPFGRGWPLDSARGRNVVIVAGGIGLAPLRPAIYEILRHRRQFGKVALLYGARTPDEILFRREIERWRSRLDLEVMVTVDRAAGGWLGSVGVVTTLIPRISFALEDTVAFICGPEIMMRFSARDLIDRGIPPAQVHVSMERNMKCGVGLCGHCQWGADFVCKDGPVYTYAEAETRLAIREV